MVRAKYRYNPKTCNYERIEVSNWDFFFDAFGFLAVALVMAAGIFGATTHYLDSPKAIRLKKENARLRLHYEQVQKEIQKSHQVLAHLQRQDDQLYRMILEAEPLSSSIRKAGVGGAEQHTELFKTDKLIAGTLQKVDHLKRELYIQSKSYEKVAQFARDKKQMLACIPAINPLSKKSRPYVTSHYGWRPSHPVLKVPKMHHGIDIAARRGTPIYATGDGVVKQTRQSFTGYGNQVLIEHGYGFTTRYCHLQKINVKTGQKIKRGQCIGYLGSSGTVTGAHLHYEVLKNNKSRNPAHYFMNDLNAAEYEMLVELAAQKIPASQ